MNSGRRKRAKNRDTGIGDMITKTMAMTIQTNTTTAQTIGDSKVRISVEGTQDHEEYVPSVSPRAGRSPMMPISESFGSWQQNRDNYT